jgi:hypothetical protein
MGQNLCQSRNVLRLYYVDNSKILWLRNLPLVPLTHYRRFSERSSARRSLLLQVKRFASRCIRHKTATVEITPAPDVPLPILRVSWSPESPSIKRSELTSLIQAGVLETNLAELLSQPVQVLSHQSPNPARVGVVCIHGTCRM